MGGTDGGLGGGGIDGQPGAHRQRGVRRAFDGRSQRRVGLAFDRRQRCLRGGLGIGQQLGSAGSVARAIGDVDPAGGRIEELGRPQARLIGPHRHWSLVDQSQRRRRDARAGADGRSRIGQRVNAERRWGGQERAKHKCGCGSRGCDARGAVPHPGKISSHHAYDNVTRR